MNVVMFAERGYVWNEGNLAGERTRADSAPRLPTPTRLTVRVMFEVRVSVRVKAMGKVNIFLASRSPVRGKLRASVFILQTLFSFYMNGFHKDHHCVIYDSEFRLLIISIRYRLHLQREQQRLVL